MRPSLANVGMRLVAGACVALLAAWSVHWTRYGLVPPQWGATAFLAVWGALSAVAGLCAAARPALAPWLALLISACTLLPFDLWPIAGLLFVLVPASLPPRPWAWAVFAVVLPVFTLPLAANERIYGPLTDDAVAAVLQTRPHEALDYLRQLFTPGLALVWAGYALSLAAVTWARRRHPPGTRLALATWCLGLPLALWLAVPGLTERAQVVRNTLRLAPAADIGLAPPPVEEHVPSDRQDLDVVFLLGEATSRTMWSLYGFPRPTTPRLAERSHRMVVMSDAVSPHSHTVPAVRAMFYRETPPRPPAEPGVDVSLVSALKSAGVQVEWFSAQERMGPWALPVTRLGEQAHRYENTNTLTGRPALGSDPAAHPDRLAHRRLLQALAAPAGGPRLLVHHFFAAHSPYCIHAPDRPLATGPTAPPVSGPAFFGDGVDRSGDLGCYLSSMSLIDGLIADTLDAADRQGRPTIVIFVPDHGEAPLLGTGHNAQKHSAWHVEVPMLVSFNGAARQRMGAQWQALEGHRDTPFLTSWVFELVLDLFGLEGKGLDLQGASLAKADSPGGRRELFPGGAAWDYDRYEPWRRKDILSDARLVMQAARQDGRFAGVIYAHRVNTLGKALAARDRFPGIETDVWYDAASDALQILHPPKPPTGLLLDHQLAALQARPALRLWLDFKNLDAGNVQPVLRQLGRLDGLHAIRGRTVVEVPVGLPPEVGRALTDAGWVVSLYLPDDLAACAARPPGDAGCSRRAQEMLRAVQLTGARHLSFDISVWPAARSFLAPAMPPGLSFLAWDLSMRVDRPDFLQRVARLPPLQGFIVPFPTEFDY